MEQTQPTTRFSGIGENQSAVVVNISETLIICVCVKTSGNEAKEREGESETEGSMMLSVCCKGATTPLTRSRLVM